VICLCVALWDVNVQITKFASGLQHHRQSLTKAMMEAVAKKEQQLQQQPSSQGLGGNS
jgi:hypothetical protein